jgi:hypothetical protein
MREKFLIGLAIGFSARRVVLGARDNKEMVKGDYPRVRRKLLRTTLTEENAIAKPARAGPGENPIRGSKAPAAKGTAIRL